jgi:hypothetical protein
MRLPNHGVVSKWIQLYTRAHEKGLDFDLSFGDVKRLVDTKHCYYSGITMTRPPRRISKDVKLLPSDRTIDRIDSEQGYVKSNVVACCHALNKWKAEVMEDTNHPQWVGVEVATNIIKAIEQVRNDDETGGT